MGIDTVLTIAGGVVGFSVVILGAVVTFFPPKTTRAKVYYLAGFVLIGLCGMAVVIGQTIRAGKTQAEAKASQERLEAQLISTQDELRGARKEIAELTTQGREIKEQTKQPPQVTVTTPAPIVKVVPSEATQVERTEAATKRQAIRQRLGLLMEQGRRLKIQCQNEAVPPPNAEANKWAVETEAFLRTSLGDEYVSRFRNSAGMPMGFTTLSSEPHRKLESGLIVRLFRLDEFLKELK